MPMVAMSDYLRVLLGPLLKDRLLHVLLVLAMILWLVQPMPLKAVVLSINTATIQTLTGLMLLTKGIELSHVLDHLGRQMIARLRNQRTLAVFLVSAAALLSTLLSNDIALFIVVPLTLSLRVVSDVPIAKLVIFEALAVNAGSMLTPIGNPQNILLWQQSHLSFMAFTLQMAPLAALIMLVLLVATLCVFPGQDLQRRDSATGPAWNGALLGQCVLAYLVFLFAVDSGYPGLGLSLLLVYVLLFCRRIVLAVDWSLIAVFVLMFVDIHLLTAQASWQPLLLMLRHQAGGELLGTGLLGSQVISNVPATILLLNYVPASKALAYAVNVGGFGFVLGSMANLIALRLSGERGIWIRFHLYSLPMLAISTLLAYLLL